MPAPAGLPVVRDYLYVDLGRVRSLLAQLLDGAPETATDHSDRISNLSARLSLGSLASADAGRSRSSSAEERRSLTDLHFSLLEETAESLGLLSDITDIASDRKRWPNGEVAAMLEPSRMFRVTAPLRMVDPVHFKDALDRVDSIVDAMIPMTDDATRAPPNRSGKGGQPARLGAKQRDAKKQQMLGELPPDMLNGLGKLVESLMAGGITIRSMPCGVTCPDCAFTGVLLDRSDYIEPERSVIFSRYGSHSDAWTLVALVARHGEAKQPSPALPEIEEFDQLAIEDLVTGVLDMLSSLGATGSPRWPSISVVPLALYRVLVVEPPVPQRS